MAHEYEANMTNKSTHSPVWGKDGNPENLLAAAMDAYEWIKRFRYGGNSREAEKLRNCTEHLKRQINNAINGCGDQG